MERNILTMEQFTMEVKKRAIQRFPRHQIVTERVKKNNGLELTALTIRAENSNISPAIYLEGFFEAYIAGESLETVMEQIIALYEKSKGEAKNFDVRQLVHFEQIKDRICFKLINAERNKKLLQEIPHRMFHDLAIVYYIFFKEEKRGMASILVRNEVMERWNTTEEELYQAAFKNTPKLLKGKIRSLEDVVTGVTTDRAEEMLGESTCELEISEGATMYLVSNRMCLNGAGVILYDKVLAKFAERIGSDFYILPSSINEVLLVPRMRNAIDTRCLLGMVREVNECDVSEEEILSDNVYYYNAQTGKICMEEG